MGSQSISKLRLEDVRIFGWTDATQYFWGQVPNLDVDEVLLMSGQVQPSEPVKIVIERGTRASDFLGNGLLLWIASERIVRLFKEEGLTGYATYPVEVWSGRHRINGYAGLSILGKAGPIDNARSKVKWFRKSSGVRGGISSIDGLYFDPGNWDGSDIFVVDEAPLLPILRERTWKALVRSGATNFRPRRVTDHKFGDVPRRRRL